MWQAIQAGTNKEVEDTATGNPATFTTDLAKALTGLTIPFTPIQAGTGDPSPTNVRAISGFTGVNVYHSGEDTSEYDTYAVTFPAMGNNLIDNETCPLFHRTITSNNEWSKVTTAMSTAIVCKPNTTYSIKAFNESVTTLIAASMPYSLDEVENVSKVPLTGRVVAGNSVPRHVTITTGSSDICLLIQASMAYLGEREAQIMVVEGDTIPTAFEPYTNTAYGGTLDAVSGVLTVDKMLFAKNSATMNNTEDYPGWNPAGVRAYNPQGGSFNNAVVNIGTRYAINVSGSNDILYLPKQYYGNMTQSDFKELGIDIQIVYSLATPQTIQLDPVTIQTLIGNNTVWTDTNGTNTVKYLSKG